MADKKLVGKITHYFSKIGVGVIELKDTIKIGDKISIEGATTNIQQEIKSMQVHGKEVKEAKKGDDIGMKVSDRVREGDQVFKVVKK